MLLKTPAKPVPAGFHPTGAETRKVKDADTWWTLAAERAVDPLWLVRYNFETVDPAEVNWYLKNRVGCTKTTANGRNYVFSSSDRPGLVFLPAAGSIKGIKSLAFGKYGVVIEGDEEYRRQVQTTLTWIARSDTGMVLLRGIQKTGRTITISAYATAGECNASATAVSYADAARADYPLLANNGKIMTQPSLVRWVLGLPEDMRVGTGAGSDSTVKFTPTMFGHGATGPCLGIAGAPGTSPSQVLFHELAHAYRQARGQLNKRKTIGGSATYTDMEEFFAVVLSNVYISDPTNPTGNRTLRADHHGFGPLAPELSTSRGFVSHMPSRNKLRELIATEPELTKELGSVKSAFNPFAESL